MDIRDRFSRRRLLGGVGAFSAGSLLFAACGQPAAMEPGGEMAEEETAKAEEEKPAMAEPVEVQWLTHHNSRQLDNVDGLVKEPFENDNPGITLKWIIWTGDRREFLQTLVAGGQAPDVAWLTDPALTALGAVEAIDDRVAKDQVDLSPFPEAAMDAWFRRDGKLFALPNQSGGDWPVSPTNKRMYEEAGLNLPPTDWTDPDWDFDRFTSEMKLLTKEDGGKTSQFGLLGASPVYLFIDWPNLFDTEWIADDNRTVTSDDPALVDAYERFFTMAIQDRSVDKPGQVNDLFGTNVRTAFVEERGAMLRSAPGGFFMILEAIQRGAPFVYSPVVRGTSAQPVSHLNLDGNGIVVGSKQPDAGWALIKWGSQTINWAISRGTGFHRVDFFDEWAQNIYGDAEFQAEVRLEVYRDALQYAVPAGRSFRSAAYNQIRDQLITPIFGDLFEGKVTVQEALRGMKQPMQALVDEALAG